LYDNNTASISEASGLLSFDRAVQFLESDALTHSVIYQAKEANRSGLSVPHLSVRSQHQQESTIKKSDDDDWVELAGVPQEQELKDMLLSIISSSSSSSSTPSSSSSGNQCSSVQGSGNQCSSVQGCDSEREGDDDDLFCHEDKNSDVFATSKADVRAAIQYEWRYIDIHLFTSLDCALSKQATYTATTFTYSYIHQYIHIYMCVCEHIL
jgi:hypothetical protein